MQPSLLSAVLVIAVAAPVQAQLVQPSYSETGDGCIESGNIVYELFRAGEPIDLDGRSLAFSPNGRGSYAVVPGTHSPLPFGRGSATAVDIGAADDDVDAGRVLSFQFPYPGADGMTATTDTLYIAPNGHVYLQADADPRCCSGLDALVHATSTVSAPGFSILGSDLNASRDGASGGGRVWFDEQSVRGVAVAVVTWDQVNEFAVVPAVAHTFQAQFFADGEVRFVYMDLALPSYPVLVGWSAGPTSGAQPQPDLGADDLSAGVLDLGDGSISVPIGIRPAVEAVEGRGFGVELVDLPAAAVAAAVVVGVKPLDSPLAALGAPGCSFFLGRGFGVVPVQLSGGAVPTADLGVLPRTLGGGAFFVQGIAVVPGGNPLGVQTTERGRVLVGDDLLFERGVVLRAQGENTFNSDTSTGFFTVAHNDPSRAGLRISGLILDASGTDQNFDTDQDNIGGRFDGGDRGAPGCGNTYRNGTEVVTGLVYAATDASICDPGASGTGWVSSNPTSTAATVDTLEFRFDDFQFGEVFEFDADTDGPTNAGDDMAGIRVTVIFSDGTRSTAPIVAFSDGLGGVVL